jgi:hypothetical protein
LSYDFGRVVDDYENTLDRNLQMTVDKASKGLAEVIVHTLESDDYNVPGQVSLSDVPRLVLSPEEIAAAAGYLNEIAQLKMFKLAHSSSWPYRYYDAGEWRLYTSTIKFVDRGFKPTKADLAINVKRR